MTFHNTVKIFVIGLMSSVLLANADTDTKVSALEFDHINQMNARCLKHAEEVGHNVAIAIYDQGGVLLSFLKTDGASPAAGEVARWKGLSAAYYRVSTATTAEWNVPTAPKIATIQGGLPITSTDGKPLGGIGVSGAPPEIDEECSALATQAVGLRN